MFDLKKISFLVIVPILLIFLIAIYFIGKNYGKAKAGAEDTDNLNSEIKPNLLSYPFSTYKDMADTLFTAMLGVGTDYDTIKSTLAKLNNSSDFFQLQKSFGTKASATYLWVYTPFSGTLIQWLSNELNDDEKKEMSDLLLTKNITLTI